MLQSPHPTPHSHSPHSPAQLVQPAIPSGIFRILTSVIRAGNNVAGGMSFVLLAKIFGGSGTVYGAAIGAMLLMTINRALPIVHIQDFWQQAVVGALIVGAIVLDRALALRLRHRLVVERDDDPPVVDKPGPATTAARQGSTEGAAS